MTCLGFDKSENCLWRSPVMHTVHLQLPPPLELSKHQTADAHGMYLPLFLLVITTSSSGQAGKTIETI